MVALPFAGGAVNGNAFPNDAALADPQEGFFTPVLGVLRRATKNGAARHLALRAERRTRSMTTCAPRRERSPIRTAGPDHGVGARSGHRRRSPIGVDISGLHGLPSQESPRPPSFRDRRWVSTAKSSKTRPIPQLALHARGDPLTFTKRPRLRSIFTSMRRVFARNHRLAEASITDTGEHDLAHCCADRRAGARRPPEPSLEDQHPGMTGAPGKWPWKWASFIVTFFDPEEARSPTTTSSYDPLRGR